MTINTKPLAGQVALVTGAGRGIGEAIAKGWAELGAKVVCAARTQSQLDETVAAIQQAGGEAAAVTVDVAVPAQVQSMADQAARAFGGLDIVLINAGGNFTRGKVDGADDAEGWVNTVQVNLIGAYLTARAVIPHLKARGGGKILTMGSGMGHRGVPGHSAYCVAKAGAWMFVRVLAQELVEHGISVNEIIPGPVWTPATREEHATHGWAVAETPGEWVKQPEELVPMANFLATQPKIGPTAQTFSLMRRDK